MLEGLWEFTRSTYVGYYYSVEEGKRECSGTDSCFGVAVSAQYYPRTDPLFFPIRLSHQGEGYHVFEKKSASGNFSYNRYLSIISTPKKS